nr:MAG TPA: hypothetical protein [Caudoviricetes sp.]DAG95692.1 MAG TPA: hypothetical protein [Crassvirales sp.]
MLRRYLASVINISTAPSTISICTLSGNSHLFNTLTPSTPITSNFFGLR